MKTGKICKNVGFSKTSGNKDFYATLGAPLIMTPLKHYKVWNGAVNKAIQDADIDTLMDMNQMVLRRSGSDEYEKAILKFAMEYLGINEIYTDLEK